MRTNKKACKTDSLGFEGVKGPYKVESRGIKGYACCVSRSGLHGILMAPTENTLKRLLTDFGLDPKEEVSASLFVIGKYEGECPVAPIPSLPAPPPKLPDPAATSYPFEPYWFVHAGLNSAFIDNEKYVSAGCVRLGPAVKQTELECKFLLRKAGWIPARFNSVKISTDYIPF